MSRLTPLRRRIALWLCPELAPPATLPVDPVDLPIWPTMSRPKWWGHVELRTFLTATHRKMPIAAVQAEAVSRFGDGVPSLSALHRYWQQLDVYREAQNHEARE